MFPALATCLLLVHTAKEVHAVPPAACFARFRGEDCGARPRPVLYYWAAGSRCEVGVWRGCLPNTNMFRDEYECVATCVFSARAAPEDYHAHMYNEVEDDTNSQEGQPDPDASDNATDGGNETAPDGNATVAPDNTTGQSDGKSDGPDGKTESSDDKTDDSDSKTDGTGGTTPGGDGGGDGGGDDGGAITTAAPAE